MDQSFKPENFIIGDDGGEVTFNGGNLHRTSLRVNFIMYQ
jgi:hypothetical protein